MEKVLTYDPHGGNDDHAFPDRDSPFDLASMGRTFHGFVHAG